MGMKRAREIENPAKITPSYTPEAPRSSAKRGKSGAIIPTPSIEEKAEIARTGKTFFMDSPVEGWLFWPVGRQRGVS